MSNSCTHCPHKGDIKACKAIECYAHESWYALEMIAQNADLLEALDKAVCLLHEAGARLRNVDPLEEIYTQAKGDNQ